MPPDPVSPVGPDPVPPAQADPVPPAQADPVPPAQPDPVPPAQPDPVPPAQPDPISPVEPHLELLGRFRAELGEPLEVGQTLWGRRRVIPIAGGAFDGPALRGTILPGGADWQVVHPDGMATIDTRYTLKTHDGALISVATQGVRHGPRDVLERISAGELVDPAEYYFRVSIRYETAEAEYAWLNRLVAVASAVRLATTVVYDAYAVR